MRCAPSRTAKEALRAASAIADAVGFAIGQPPEVDVNEIIVRPGRKHALITRSRLPERPVDRKRAASQRPCCGAEPEAEAADLPPETWRDGKFDFNDYLIESIQVGTIEEIDDENDDED